MNELLTAISIESGAILEIAEQLAVHGIDASNPTAGPSAA